MINAGRVVTHQHLLKELWGPAHADSTHNLRTYIGYLRKKLRDDPSKPRFIEAAPGTGYCMLPAEAL